MCVVAVYEHPMAHMAETLGFFDLSEGRVRKITELGQVNFLNYLHPIQEAPSVLMSTGRI